MNALTLFSSTSLDPATLDLLLSVGLSTGLVVAAALTIAALPWSDRDLLQVDRAARHLIASPMRRLAALSRQAALRS